jgi:hypothetical protein
MTGIYFLQLMLMCVLLVKKFPYALLVLPLLVFTVVFHIVNNSGFSRPWRLGNARESAMLDARDHVSRDVMLVDDCTFSVSVSCSLSIQRV